MGEDPAPRRQASYHGYEYQKEVTAWLALSLMFVRRLTETIEVEPPSEEDVAAALDVDAEEAHSGLSLKSGVPTEFQIKYRENTHWTPASLRDVLKGKPPKGEGTPRVRPLSMLRDDPSLRFVLVTNTDVASELEKFVVSHPADTHGATAFPKKMFKVADRADEVASRFAIVKGLSRPALQTEVLLRDACGVPEGDRGECFKELVAAVHQRLLGTVTPAWSVEDVRALLTDFHGLPPSDPPEHLVAPAKIEELIEQLDKERILILRGGPGLGKTQTAREIARRYRNRNPPYRVIGQGDPSGHHGLGGNGASPQLTLLDDPFGKTAIEPGAGGVVDALEYASPKRHQRILVTTRPGVFAEACGGSIPTALESRVINVTSELLSRVQRWQILVHELPAGGWQLAWVAERREQIEAELDAPFSYSRLGRLLSTSEEGGALAPLLEKVLVSSIGRHIQSELCASQADPGGVVIVALVAQYYGGLSTERLSELAARLTANADRARPQAVMAFLRRGGWLEKGWGRSETLHPTVRKGLVDYLLDRHPDNITEVMGALVRVDGPPDDWPKSIAWAASAEAVGLVSKGELTGPLEASVVERLRAAAKPGAERSLGAALDLATLVSEPREPAVLLASVLAESDRVGGSWFNVGWPRPFRRPSWTDAQRGAVRDSELAKSIALAVVRSPGRMADFRFEGDTLPPFFESIGWDLESAFREVLEGTEPLFWVPYVLEGSLRGEDAPFDEYLTEILDWLRVLRDEPQLDQDSLGAAEREWRIECFVEDGASAERQLVAIVTAKIRSLGWAWLERHKAPDVVAAWARSMKHRGGVVSAEEISALLAARSPESLRHVAHAIGTRLEEAGIQPLLAAWVDDGGANSDGYLRGIFAAAEPDVIRAQLERKREQLGLPLKAALLEAANRVRSVDKSSPYDVEVGPYQAAVAEALQPFPILVWAATGGGVEPSLDDEPILRELASKSSDAVRGRALARLLVLGVYEPELVNGGLVLADPGAREHVIEALAASADPRGVAAASAALEDPLYYVRQTAVRALAPHAEGELRLRILARSTDPSGSVRSAVAEAIGRHQWRDGIGELTELLRDTQDFDDQQYGYQGPPQNDVARAAAVALSRFELTDEQISAVAEVSGQGLRDPKVSQAVQPLLQSDDASA